MLEVAFTLHIPVEVKRKGSIFVSHTPALDVYSQGPTKKKALDNLVEAVQLFLMSCFERGTLVQVLRDCGFRPSDSVSEIPANRRDTVAVQLPFHVGARSDERCHA